MINEVRLPNGYFKVNKTFYLLASDGFDDVFTSDKIIKIDTVNKSISIWNNEMRKWITSGITYNQMMNPEYYTIFKSNTSKIDAESLPKDIEIDTNINTFTTTVKSFNKKADELGLEPTDKIKISY